MRALIPPPASGVGQPLGRTGRWLGFGLTAKGVWLLAAGLPLTLPAFWRPHLVWFMAAWDGLVLLLAGWEAWRLPRPRAFAVTRTFLDSPQLGLPTRVELAIETAAESVLELSVTDDLHPALTGVPRAVQVELFPHDTTRVVSTCWPGERGEFALGLVFLRWRGALGLAERWGAVRPVVQRENAGERGEPARVRVYSAQQEGKRDMDFFLMRARQMERQRRQQRLRGGGREFESLREYQPGDELRSVSWTATARRGRIVTRTFMAERSQTVWAVLDAGRLSRTALELHREEQPTFLGETEAERDRAHRMTVTQLDQATAAAIALAKAVGRSGDKMGLLAYGTSIQQVVPPGAGPAHLRTLVEMLSSTRSDPGESDPLLAVSRLKQLQGRRGLMVWITEQADSAGRPPLVTALADLARRHLVVVVLLRHPELESLADTVPVDRAAMFHAAAALELIERRRETMATLERLGVLLVEATADELGVRTVSEYLEVKARGLL